MRRSSTRRRASQSIEVREHAALLSSNSLGPCDAKADDPETIWKAHWFPSGGRALPYLKSLSIW